MSIEAWRDRAFASADTALVRYLIPTQWVRREIRIAVPDDSTVHSVVISLGVRGAGVARFDDLELAVDGKVITTLAPNGWALLASGHFKHKATVPAMAWKP